MEGGENTPAAWDSHSIPDSQSSEERERQQMHQAQRWQFRKDSLLTQLDGTDYGVSLLSDWIRCLLLRWLRDILADESCHRTQVLAMVLHVLSRKLSVLDNSYWK